MNFLKKIKNLREFFHVIISIIKKNRKENQIFIINLDKNYQKGSHWIGLSIKNFRGYYFDSFGLKIYNKNILNFLKKIKIKKISYNTKIIQKISDVNCGHYCIGFAIFISQFNCLKKFIDCFSDNTKKNSLIIKKIIKKYIKFS